jgi:D-aminopeptidase
VGHCTIDTNEYKTGVTVVMPCRENPFTHKLPAASFVLNGFGKSLGLVQIDELGQLESPIFLTNTLNVGKVHDAAVGYLARRCEDDGVPLRSVNPVVCECNDGSLSRITHRPVEQSHVSAAIAAASEDFDEGDVGAGKGMICHDLKGGIGSASRLLDVDGQTFTLGVLALTNHGSLRDLTIDGQHIGPALAEKLQAKHTPDVGSCILIMATDLPLDSRQLGRVVRRGSVGLARLGSYIGHGSGEVFVGFSTANAWDSRDSTALRQMTGFSENKMDLPFRAMAECTEEAVLNAMAAAHTVTGYTGRTVYALTDLWRPGQVL